MLFFDGMNKINRMDGDDCGGTEVTVKPVSERSTKKIRVHRCESALIRVPLPIGRMRGVFVHLAEAQGAQRVFGNFCYGAPESPPSANPGCDDFLSAADVL